MLHIAAVKAAVCLVWIQSSYYSDLQVIRHTAAFAATPGATGGLPASGLAFLITMPSTNHRKLVKHFDLPGHAHELTFSCYRRFPLLLDDRCKVLLSQAIDRAMTGQGYSLLAFVYMPEHVHLLVMPNRPDASISALLSAIKRPSSYRIRLWMQQQGDPILERLMILERPGKTTYRFWQEGSGYDRNITESDTLGKVVDYLHANPVRRGLVATESHWHWSSWHHYHGDKRTDQNLPTVHDGLNGM